MHQFLVKHATQIQATNYQSTSMFVDQVTVGYFHFSSK